MSRITQIDSSSTDSDNAGLLSGLSKKLACIPYFITMISNTSATDKAYLGFTQLLFSGYLSPLQRERIALVVNKATNSGYCLAVHTAIIKKRRHYHERNISRQT